MIKRISPRILLLTLAIALIQQIVSAQQPQETIEYGSVADLKGVEKIFIYTGPDIGLRNSIIKEITRKLKNIIVTDEPFEGEVCLMYGVNSETFYAGTTANGTVTDDGNTTTAQVQSRPQYRTATHGIGSVVILKPNNVRRIIMDFKDTKGDKPPLATVFERNPASNFARAFVKAYQEANKEEKKK